MAIQLTGKAEELLTALQSSVSGWYSRSEVAKILSKPRLNPYEVDMLDALVDAGYLERSEQLRGIKPAIVYRVKELANG